MFLRVTWFESSPDRLEDAISTYKQLAAPALSKMQGNVGVALQVNRETGAGAAISYWDSMASMQASEDAAVGLRSQAAADARLTIGEIDRFELIVLERAKPPAANTFVRVNDITASPDKIEAVASLVRDAQAMLKAQKGFRAVLMGANRQTGRMFISSIWDTAADREASEAAVAGQRNKLRELGAQNVKVSLTEAPFVEVKQAAPA